MHHPYEDNLFEILRAMDLFIERFNNIDSDREEEDNKEIDDFNIVADVEYKEVND